MSGRPCVAGALLLLFGFTSKVAPEALPFQLLHQKNGFAQEAFGYAVAGAGDVSDDGKADFIVGNYRASPNGLAEAGAIYVYSGADGALLYQVDGSGQTRPASTRRFQMRLWPHAGPALLTSNWFPPPLGERMKGGYKTCQTNRPARRITLLGNSQEVRPELKEKKIPKAV